MTHSVPFGTRIAGRYEVAGRPLMGGMGIVFLCYDHQEDRPVALKTFKPEYLPNRAARDRFLREGTLWMDLDRHPHVVRCYGVERIGDGREVYLVLEQVAKMDGKPDASLRAWLLPGQPLPLETALLFGLQIVRGMRHAVERLPGFVHRDLKPENVLVGADRMPGSDVQRLRVTDFGLAGVLAEMADKDILSPEKDVNADTVSNPRRTQLTHGVVGTPPYMAPEQWRGEQLTVATDVYAFGCILQEMLSGVPAVKGRSIDDYMAAHLQGKLLPLPKDIPGDVSQLVRRCVALEPGQRYGNWAELETALTNVCGDVTGMPVPALPEPDELAREERVALGWAQSNLGASYLDIGKAAVAVDYFERAQAVGADEQESRLQAAGLTGLGAALYLLGQVEHAVDHYQQALSISRKIGDRRNAGTVLGNLGSAYVELGHIEQAIDHYQRALSIAREFGDRRFEGSLLGYLGTTYRNLGQIERAIDYYHQSLSIARETLYRRCEGENLGELGTAYRNLGQVEQAIDYHKQALAIAREIGNRHNEGNHLGNLGNDYADLGQIEAAIDHYEKALLVTREIGNRAGEGNQLGNLGLVYANLGQVEQAIDYYEQALDIHREIGNQFGMAAGSLNLALAHAKHGETTQALRRAQEAVELFTNVGHSAYADRARRLVTQIQRLPPPPPTAGNPYTAFQAFQQADSPAAMRTAVDQHPILTDPGFMDAIAQAIQQQVPPQLQPAFQQRLDWLRQIAAEQGS